MGLMGYTTWFKHICHWRIRCHPTCQLLVGPTSKFLELIGSRGGERWRLWLPSHNRDTTVGYDWDMIGIWLGYDWDMIGIWLGISNYCTLWWSNQTWLEHEKTVNFLRWFSHLNAHWERIAQRLPKEVTTGCHQLPGFMSSPRFTFWVTVPSREFM